MTTDHDHLDATTEPEPDQVEPDPRPRPTIPDASGHLLPVAPIQPALEAEYRLRFFSTSTVGGSHVTEGALTLDEAESIASRLRAVAFVIERRMVGPWQPTSAPQRNRVVRDPVDRDDPADLHPDAPPPYRPRAGRPVHGMPATHDDSTPRATRDEATG